SPFVFGRVTTSLTELPLGASSRSRVRSARLPIPGMPRSQMGVARFYDWSDDPAECFPISRLYREIASVPRLPVSKLSRVNASNASTHDIKIGISTSRNYAVGQGRMFFRDKKALTRGEKEIIEGIYKNRRDQNARELLGKSDVLIKSHQDAWNYDKSGNINLSRVLLKGEKIDTNTPRVSAFADAKTSPTPSARKSSGSDSLLAPGKTSLNRTTRYPDALLVSTCLTCQKLQDDYENTQYIDSGPSAPPSSPDIWHPRHKPTSVPTFYKLLSSRPSVQPNSVLLADRMAALRLDPSQLHDQMLNSVSTHSHRCVVSPASSRDFSEIPNPENIETSNQDANSEALLGAANWVLQCDERPERGSSGGEKRKIAVQIYVPTAEEDVADDETNLLVKSSMARQRPISHRTYVQVLRCQEEDVFGKRVSSALRLESPTTFGQVSEAAQGVGDVGNRRRL
ncbi:transcription factor mef2A, partial [Biomphalaria pfeifferi]